MISLTAPVETRAHRWPAGIKLGMLCGATMVLFAVQDALWQMGFLLATLMLYALPGRRFVCCGLGRLWVLWPFVVLIVIWHLIRGEALVGLVIAMRMVSAVALANLVTMTTRLSDMMRVVQVLCRPLRHFGVSTRPIELAMALVVRFTPVLAHKGQTLAQAWRARAVGRVGWRIVLPLTVLAIDDADHVAEAIRARGGV